MGFLRKKPDPISDRSKALNAQIASLEAEIKKLDSKLHQPQVKPQPAPSPVPRNGSARPAPREPVFESVDRKQLKAEPEQEQVAEHYNDLGVRKYDLAATWRRWRQQFGAAPASNPKLVTYLAAGSIKGLRPLRYEKRIARNRFIALFVVLVFLVWGIIAVFVRSR